MGERACESEWRAHRDRHALVLGRGLTLRCPLNQIFLFGLSPSTGLRTGLSKPWFIEQPFDKPARYPVVGKA